jgi:hypothetical protein
MKPDFARWVEKPDGLYSPRATSNLIVALGCGVVIGAAVFLLTGRPPWALALLLLVWAADFAFRARIAGFQGPLLSCNNGILRLVDRNRRWKVYQIVLREVAAISFYPAAHHLVLQVRRKDGRVDECALWRHPGPVQADPVIDYLRRNVGADIEIVRRDPPSFFESVRGA